MLIVGPEVPQPLAPLLRSIVDAISALQGPGAPVRMPSVALKASLPPAADWPLCSIICEEINSQVSSTLVGSTWTWLRANGSAL